MTDIIKDAICHIAANATDPFQMYLLRKELMNAPVEDNLVKQIRASKHYTELAETQWDDGSWGRFHSMDSHAAKTKFATTESALKRMRDLGLGKGDPMVDSGIALMESYLKNEAAWRDNIEKHNDGGKSHMRFRYFCTAANLNLFDPENTAITPFREVCVEQIRAAFASGEFDESAWRRRNADFSGTCLEPFMAHTLWLVQRGDYLGADIERAYLKHIWERREGIYYIYDARVSQPLSIENRRFPAWLAALETLSGFAPFPELMRRDIFDYLQVEIAKLLFNECKLPASSAVVGRYCENSRLKGARANDMLLRILRILVKC